MPCSVTKTARSVVPGGMADTSGAAHGRDLRLDDAPRLRDGLLGVGTSRSTLVSRVPSSLT